MDENQSIGELMKDSTPKTIRDRMETVIDSQRCLISELRDIKLKITGYDLERVSEIANCGNPTPDGSYNIDRMLSEIESNNKTIGDLTIQITKVL